MSSSNPEIVSNSESAKPRYGIEDLFKVTGGFGKMQWLCLIICFVSLQGGNFYWYTLNYLLLYPEVKCGVEGSRESCEISDICQADGSLLPKDQWEIDWSHGYSIHNWMTEHELYCLDAFKVGMFGSARLFGYLFSFPLLKLADNFGRKPIFVIAAVMNVVGCFGLYFFSNIYIKYTLLFILGVSCAKLSTTYIYVAEITPKKAGMF